MKKLMMIVLSKVFPLEKTKKSLLSYKTIAKSLRTFMYGHSPLYGQSMTVGGREFVSSYYEL